MSPTCITSQSIFTFEQFNLTLFFCSLYLFEVSQRKLNRTKMRMDYNDTKEQEYIKRQQNVLAMRDHLEEGLQKLKSIQQHRIKQIQITKRMQPLQISAQFKRASFGNDINYILGKNNRQYCPYFYDYCHNNKNKTSKQKPIKFGCRLYNESRDYTHSLFFQNFPTFKDTTQIKQEHYNHYYLSDDHFSNDDVRNHDSSMNTVDLKSRSEYDIKRSNEITISQQAAERIYGRLKTKFDRDV